MLFRSNDTATTEIYTDYYTLSLHDALPNSPAEVDTTARKTGGLSVSYPEGAPRLKSGDSVSVSVAFVVNENGEVTDARVVESGGKILDEAVVAAVRGWKYAPAVKKGTKVKVHVTFKQTFRAG